MWTKRGKACLILIISTNSHCESMAYPSFRSEEYSARGVGKVTTGITNRHLQAWIPSGVGQLTGDQQLGSLQKAPPDFKGTPHRD